MKRGESSEAKEQVRKQEERRDNEQVEREKKAKVFT